MRERREDKLPDEVNVVRINNSYYISIPPKLRNYLGLDEHSTVKIQPECGDYGRYASFWNPDE